MVIASAMAGAIRRRFHCRDRADFYQAYQQPLWRGLYLWPRWLAMVADLAADHFLVCRHDEHHQLAGWVERVGGRGDGDPLHCAGDPHALFCRPAATERGDLARGVVGGGFGLFAAQFYLDTHLYGQFGELFSRLCHRRLGHYWRGAPGDGGLCSGYPHFRCGVVDLGSLAAGPCAWAWRPRPSAFSPARSWVG